jgi:hypothetical protein
LFMFIPNKDNKPLMFKSLQTINVYYSQYRPSA